MHEFAAVWKWTAEEKRGIFTLSPPSGSLKTNEHPPSIPVKQHLLLIKVKYTKPAIILQQIVV